MNTKVLVAGAATAVLVIAAVVVVITLLGDDDVATAGAPAAATSPASASPGPAGGSQPTDTTAPTTPTPASATGATTAADAVADPLCRLAADFAQAVDGHLPVQDPDDLMAVSEANRAFYAGAAEVVDPPEQDAFAEYAEYEERMAEYHAGADWSPSPGLDYAMENLPEPPSGDATNVIGEVLQERCGVEPPKDEPAQ